MIRVHAKSGKFIALLPADLSKPCGFRVVVTANGVGAFKSSWPCSRLKEQPIVFEYASNGDLVDIGWSNQPDGDDLLALSQDAQEFAEKCIERRRVGVQL